jgi:hypothetical protein
MKRYRDLAISWLPVVPPCYSLMSEASERRTAHAESGNESDHELHPGGLSSQ